MTGVKTLDKGLLEIIGPTGITDIIYKKSNIFKHAHSGYIGHYVGTALLIFLATLFFLDLLGY